MEGSEEKRGIARGEKKGSGLRNYMQWHKRIERDWDRIRQWAHRKHYTWVKNSHFGQLAIQYPWNSNDHLRMHELKFKILGGPYLSLLGTYSWAGLVGCSLWGRSCLVEATGVFLAERLILSSSMLISFSESLTIIKELKLSLAHNHIQQEPFTFIRSCQGDISADI